jgi:hypothetical protein
MDRIARIAPSARLEQQIEQLLANGLGEGGEHLAELGRLGARLVLQRAVDEEVAAFLGRARYQRTPTATGSRNGTRPKPIQTAEGEISIAMPQVRGVAEQFVSRVIPDTKAVIRTRPLAALISGGYVRGLSDREIDSLANEARVGSRLEDHRQSHLPRPARSGHRVLQQGSGGCQRDGPVYGRHLSAHATQRPEGRRAGGLGVHDRRQNACCWRCGWASRRHTQIGWTWAVTSPAADCARPGWWPAMAHLV